MQAEGLSSSPPDGSKQLTTLQGWNRPGRWLVTALIVIVLEMLCFWARKYDSTIARENGPMENFQAVCLILGILVMCRTAYRAETKGHRILALGLALFYATFFILELDVRRWDIHWLTVVFNGWLRNVWLGGAWVTGLILAACNWPTTLQAFRRWFATFPAAVLLVAGLFWLVASLVDKGVLGQKTLFNEELFEVAGSWLMLQSALRF